MSEELTKENIMKRFNEDPGFMKYNNYQLEELEEDKSVMSVELNENSLNPSGIAHGGLVFGLADTAMGMLAYLTGRKVVTVDANINYLKPCKGSKVTCVAEPVKVGKTIGVYQASIYNENKELAATVIGTYFFLDREINK